MNYRPRWERILFLAAVFNVVAIFFVTSNWFAPAPKVEEEPDDLQEISWVDVPAAEAATIPPPPEVQTFPEIKLPPIEIPKIEVPKLPDPVAVEPVKEIAPAEVKPDENVKPAETPVKPADDSPNKLKAIVKVYPKDLIDQLVASGAVKERTAITSGKIVLAVTIGVDGKVKKAEIRRGGGTDERGTMINLVSEIAASSWIFEPYLDEDGKPKEMKTQIEFKPEDF